MKPFCYGRRIGILLWVAMSLGLVLSAGAGQQNDIPSSALKAHVDSANGSYSILTRDGTASINRAMIAVKADRHWLQASAYPKPSIARGNFAGELGPGHTWSVAYAGDSNRPTLIYHLRVYSHRPFAELQVTLKNSTQRTIQVEAFRSVELDGDKAINLGGREQADRVLSDSFSEDRPAMQIRDFDDPVQEMHRGVGSQLIYNRDSRSSLFIGALTSNKLLTILRLHVTGEGAATEMSAFEVECAGTTEFTKQNSLRNAPSDDQIELSIPVKPGQELSSERILIGLSKDYHNQLETYGHVIRELHHARTSPPPPMGWWSWTAYYANLTEKDALTDAEWMAKHLKSDGYAYFHIDEGYSVARGDYLTAMASRFPSGMEKVETKIQSLGLKPAIWTAPFEVSDHAWVYKQHQDWLLHDYAGKPIRLTGSSMPGGQTIYVLDVTNPGAQDYLRKTYSTMARQWGIRDFKLDFMEDSCIEGNYHRAGTTALEAQRIGLEVIRSAVGNDVLLDKDGSVMLNPVGLVDLGRISQDTSHDFGGRFGIKASAPGIAARYYMNHNYYLTDPDAFMVTRGEGNHALTLDEARTSIALAAVAGGMFEIGDKLGTLAQEPERLALLTNPDLLEMIHLSRPSVPLDLMSYRPQDLQPSIFLLKENPRQLILTVFNWSEGTRVHDISFDQLGLTQNGNYKVTSIWDGKELTPCKNCAIHLSLAPHSVQMLKIIG